MITRGSKKNMTNFLQMPNKLLGQKRRQINKSKWKGNIGETSSKKATISNLDSFDKKKLLVLILIIKKSKSKAKNIDIAIISANAYCVACCLKKAQVFAILIRNI